MSRNTSLSGISKGPTPILFDMNRPKLTADEAAERDRLHDLWCKGRANVVQITRCMELDRKVYAYLDGKRG